MSDRYVPVGHAIRTQLEVARIMTAQGDPISRTRVFQIEQRALKKLARDPVIRKLAREIGLVREEY